MTLTMDELDGTYDVRSETSDGGPYVPNGDGVTIIDNGTTYRKDKNGFIWESSFAIDGDKVRMESVIDPSHAPGHDNFIRDEKGNPTKGMITYKALLDVTREDGKLVLSGEVRHGNTVTRLTMRKMH